MDRVARERPLNLSLTPLLWNQQLPGNCKMCHQQVYATIFEVIFVYRFMIGKLELLVY